jgi:hypothetical protein
MNEAISISSKYIILSQFFINTGLRSEVANNCIFGLIVGLTEKVKKQLTKWESLVD